jgi:hypothetical protein
VSRGSWRVDLVTAAYVLGVTVLLGAPAGILWSALAPHAQIAITASGATFPNGATEVFVAGDGWFLGICAAAGILTGFLAWLGARRSGPYVVVALAVGGLLAAYIGAKVGRRIGQDELRAAAAAGTPGTYVANVALQAKQAILVWPIAALATFVTLVASRADEIDQL